MSGLLTAVMGFAGHGNEQKEEVNASVILKCKKSNGWASTGNILLMAELRKRILFFRGLLHLPPCNASVPINELLMGLMIDLHSLYPQVVLCNVAAKTPESPLNQVLIQLYNVLHSIGDSWYKTDGKMNNGRKEVRESMENVTLEQLSQKVLGKINEMIDIRKEMLEEKTSYDESMVEAPTMASDSNSSVRSISPLKGVVEHSCSSKSENPPWLFRTEAANKLKPLEMKYLPSNLASPPPPFDSSKATSTVSSSAEINSKETKESRNDEGSKRVSSFEFVLPECSKVTKAPKTTAPTGLLAIRMPSSQYLPIDNRDHVAPSNGTAPLPHLKSPCVVEASGSESNITYGGEEKETVTSPITTSPPTVLRNPEPDLLPACGFESSPPRCDDDAKEHPPSIHKRPPPPPPPLPPRNEATAQPPPIPAPTTKGPMSPTDQEAASPPPPMKGSMRPAPPPPPPGNIGIGKLLRSKNNSRLKRSILMVYVYQVLRKKAEGSVAEKSSNRRVQGKKSKIGTTSVGAKQGMADAIQEITKKSAYYQKIQEDAKKYATLVLEIKAAISAFETKDMEELVKFLNYVEENLEKLSDETQVLAKFEDFPVKKLEALRGAGALYSKLKEISKNLKNWKIVPPIGQLLDKIESYFNKIKREIEILELNKDEESKRFKSNNINFDFNVLVQVKESMVDVSSGCMELALKEWREAKASQGANGTVAMKAKGQTTTSGQVLWRTFQFAYRVYSFAGGQDDRADLLTRELARAMEIDPSPK